MYIYIYKGLKAFCLKTPVISPQLTKLKPQASRHFASRYFKSYVWTAGGSKCLP